MKRLNNLFDGDFSIYVGRLMVLAPLAVILTTGWTWVLSHL